MTDPGYRSATDVLADRIHWTHATLGALLARGRAEGWLDGAPKTAPDPDALSREIVARLERTALSPTVLPMEWLALRLGLDDGELALLWLLACVELAPAASRLAQVFGGGPGDALSVQIVRQLVAVTDGQLDALDRLVLIERTRDAQVPHPRRAVRANDRVLALARGELALDPELVEVAVLHGVEPAVLAMSTAHTGTAHTATAQTTTAPTTSSPATTSPHSPPHVATTAPAIVPALVAGISAQPAPLLLAVGPDGAGRATALAVAAGHAGLGTLRIRTHELAREPARLERQLRTALREAALFGVVPLFEDLDAILEASDALDRALRWFVGPVMATVSAPVRTTARPVIVHRLAKPTMATRAACWRAHLDDAPAEVIDQAASQYALWPGAIAAAARNARAAEHRNITAAAIHAGVRAQLGEQLDGLATRIEVHQRWDDLVLPPDQFEQLIELVARVRHRGHVLERWGFGAKLGRGHGVAALLSGPPGTGKTMAAGLIAHELRLDLYQVDLSKIVSKYIGETEKQLAALFDAAESGQAIVLFDEADALFAKRSEVKSSNDRYANLEVNFLLQRLEAFTGIALLTTNHETALDDAFRRRLALHVRFPMPDESQRAALWQAMLPAQAEVAPGVDFAALARGFEMTGGYIRNAVVRAAYLAADQGSAIDAPLLWRAARAEYESIGKLAYQRAA